MKVTWRDRDGKTFQKEVDVSSGKLRLNIEYWGENVGVVGVHKRWLAIPKDGSIDIAWEPSDEPKPEAPEYILRKSNKSGRWGLFYWCPQWYTFGYATGGIIERAPIQTLTPFILRGSTQADKDELVDIADRLGLSFTEEGR